MNAGSATPRSNIRGGTALSATSVLSGIQKSVMSAEVHRRRVIRGADAHHGDRDAIDPDDAPDDRGVDANRVVQAR